jgi:ribosomal protein S11
MAILGKQSPAAATEAVLYTVTAGKNGLAALEVCNRNAVPIKIRVALRSVGENATLPISYIEYDTPIPGNGVFERTGIQLTASEAITVQSDTANTNFIALGLEE